MTTPPFTAQVTITFAQENYASKSLISDTFSSGSSLFDAGQNAYNDAFSKFMTSFNFTPTVPYQASVSVNLSGTLTLYGRTSTVSSSGSGNAVGLVAQGQQLSVQNAYDKAYSSASSQLTVIQGVVQHVSWHLGVTGVTGPHRQ